MKKFNLCCTGLILTATAMILLFACKKSNPVSSTPTIVSCGPAVVKDSVRYYDPFNTFMQTAYYDTIYIVGDCLHLSIFSSGCDGSTWTLDAWDREDVQNSTRQLSVGLENQELCQAWIQKEFLFDISGLQVANQNTLTLNFYQFGQSVQYTY